MSEWKQTQIDDNLKARSCIHVLVASPYPLVCAGLRAALEDESRIAVVGCATTSEEAHHYCKELRPNALVVDAELLFPDATALIPNLRVHTPRTSILAVICHKDIAFVPGLVASGVSGCFLKEDNADLLTSASLSVATGGMWFSPAVIVGLSQVSTSQRATLLTNREQEVAMLLAEGCRNSAIADSLHIGLRTAEFHVKNVLAKLGVRSRAEVFRRFQQQQHILLAQPITSWKKP